MISRSYIEGHRGDFAVVDPTWFAGNSDGLLALAGRTSDVGQLLLADKHEAALARTREWLRHFGDRWYFEVTRVGHADEAHHLNGTLQIAAAADCPVVATNDVRFLTREDFEAHEARVCIHQGRQLNDPKRPRDYTPEQYLKSADEMAALFSDLPETLQNSVEIAKRCNLELSFGKYYLPAFPVPADQTTDSFIRAQSRGGLAARLAKHAPVAGFSVADYEKRLETELDVIIKMGFAGLLPHRRRLHQLGEDERHSGRTRPRFRRGFAGRVQLGHHRPGSARLQLAVRTIPQSRTRVDARLRHRLLSWNGATK